MFRRVRLTTTRGLHVNVAVALITFTTAIAVDLFLSRVNTKPIAEPSVIKPAEYKENNVTDAPNEQSHVKYALDVGQLKILNEEVQLKSEKFRYDIGARYPQILGTRDSQIRKLNRKISRLVRAQYEDELNPTEEELRYYRREWPEVFNSVQVD